MTSATSTEDRASRYGGMKFGGCFFGWLSATAMFTLLVALVAAAGAGVGVDADQLGRQQPEDIGLVAGLVLLVLLLLAYFCGGYVAGRMARFNGFRQGLGVWLWGLVVGIVLSVLGFFLSARLDLPAGVGPLPTGAIEESAVSPPVLIATGATAAVTLLGALLGGRAGMAFHRRVDRWDEPEAY